MRFQCKLDILWYKNWHLSYSRHAKNSFTTQYKLLLPQELFSLLPYLSSVLAESKGWSIPYLPTPLIPHRFLCTRGGQVLKHVSHLIIPVIHHYSEVLK